MNSKAKTKKNLTRIIALVLVAIMCVGFLGYFSYSEAEASSYDYSAGLTEEGFFEGVTALDHVILPEYDKYTMPEELTIATDDEIAEQIAAIRESFSTQEADADTTRAIVDGDTVNIDYVGTIDGVEFEGGSTEGVGTDVTIGVTSYIDGFLEQLIGHKPGESFDINVTFPDDYGNEELNGKDAVFAITINHFYKTIVPEIDDAFIAENLADYYTDVEDMKVKVAEEIVDADMKNYVWGKLIEETTVTSYNDAVNAYEVGARKANIELSATQYGVDGDTFVTLYGYESMDAYIEAMAEDIKSYEKVYLTVQAVCEKEGYKVTDEDLANYFDYMFGTTDYSAYEETYGLPYLKSIVIRDVMLNTMIENMEVEPAVVEEVTDAE